MTNDLMAKAYAFKRVILEAQAAIANWRAELFLKRYDPNQPRVAAGTSDAGRWTDADGTVTSSREHVAMAKRLTEEQCWALYDEDTFHRKMVGLRSCHEQAAFRYSDCLAGFTIRPLSY